MYFIVRPQYKKGSSILDDDKIYGVTWDGSSTTRFTRTGDSVGLTEPVPILSDGSGGWVGGSSPFDNIMPWAGMIKVEDADAGTLVAIPKFYYKVGYANPSASTKKGLTIQISRKQFEGSFISPAHMDREDGKGERDVVYVGRYHCADDSSLKSKTGVKAKVNYTRANFRYYISQNKTNVWQWDYLMLLTIQLLYLVEFACWRVELTIGGGSAKNGYTGGTDTMPYHTGSTATNPNYLGYSQYRNIEDIWGNVLTWCDGLRTSGSATYLIKNPANFSDTTGGVGVASFTSNSGYITSYRISTDSAGKDWFIYPWKDSGITGSEYTYICDYYAYNESVATIQVGGYQGGTSYGLFYFSRYYGTSGKTDYTGSRLMKLP